MSRKRFSEEQIIKALKSNEAGMKVVDICRKLGIAEQTFYRWRRKYNGMEVSDAKRLKELEAENSKLRKLLAESVAKRETLEKVLSKKVVKPAQRKQIVKDLVSAGRHSERTACALASISRIAYRYQGKQADKDRELEAALLEKAKQYPHYGYKRLHALLKSEGRVVNVKRTYRLYKKLGLELRIEKTQKAVSSTLRVDNTD